jgi:ABC-2 type transport system ATP-binding protein
VEKPVIAADIAYSYKDVTAVDHISFHIDEGEILGFLGPNGAGKTTTLNMLTGLAQPQSGRIDILGFDMIRQAKEAQAGIGVCFEEKNLYDDMSAVENLRFFAALFGIKGLDPEPLLERVDLPTDRKDRVANYSKGMKQRLMIARALVNQPRVLFLDEPTDGLDPVSARAIRKVILEEKARGASVFLTTHDMLEADKLSDRVAFINEGKIAALDTPDNLKHQYGRRELLVRRRENGEIRQEELALDDPRLGARIDEIRAAGPLLDMHTKEATLEEIFIRVTGRKLQ